MIAAWGVVVEKGESLEARAMEARRQFEARVGMPAAVLLVHPSSQAPEVVAGLAVKRSALCHAPGVILAGAEVEG